MIAHAIINTPMTPKYQVGLLALFVVGLVIFSRRGLVAIKHVFSSATPSSSALLAVVGAAFVFLSQRFTALAAVAVALLALAIALEWKTRREEIPVSPRRSI